MKKKILINIGILILCVFGVIGLCFLVTKVALPTNLTEQISTLLARIAQTTKPKYELHTNDISLSVSLLVLKNSAFVIQFASWIFSIMAIIVAFFAFIGGRELFNIRKAEREMRQAFNKLKEGQKSFKENANLEYEFTKARVFYMQECYNEAWDAISHIPDSHSFEVSLYKGMILLKKGYLSEAINAFENLLKLPEADVSRVYFNIGQCWFSSGDYKKAIELYNKTISTQSNYSDAYISKALALRRLADLDSAITTLIAILSIDNTNAKAYYNLSCYYALLGKKTDALENLKKALEFNPNRYMKMAPMDSDFKNIKKDREFTELFVVKE